MMDLFIISSGASVFDMPSFHVLFCLTFATNVQLKLQILLLSLLVPRSTVYGYDVGLPCHTHPCVGSRV